MAATPIPPSSPSRLWQAAQLAGLGLTAVLLAGLLTRPDLTLRVLWDMVIPLLPAVFLVNPMLWRNVCPLATLNQWSGRRGSGRLRAPALQGAWAIGVVLLFAMVPARRFLFNEHGAILAGTIMAVALLALGSGFLMSRRAGFCDSLCPVLPVEKLYGQAPLVRVPSAICPDCSGCAVRGCIDLVGSQSMAQSTGPGAGADRSWLATPMGAFAVLFPGFVVGYFTTVNGAPAEALAVYRHIGQWMLASGAVLGLLVAGLRLPSRVALPLIGAAALALYYWFAAPLLATAYTVAALGPVVFRGAFFVLIAASLRRTSARP